MKLFEVVVAVANGESRTVRVIAGSLNEALGKLPLNEGDEVVSVVKQDTNDLIL